MSEETLYKLRVRYRKQGRLCYLGHLEVAHTWDRAVRRAGLPFAVTQGFSPHMRIAFSSALPVGTASDSEWVDVVLRDYVPAADALDALARSIPEDLGPLQARYVDVRASALTAFITRADYRVRLEPASGALDAAAVSRALETVVSAGAITYLRGRKERSMDVRRTLTGFRATDASSGGVEVLLETHLDNDGALRPEILIAALDRALAPHADVEPIVSSGIQSWRNFGRVAIERIGQYGEGPEGDMTDPAGHASIDIL